MGALVIFGAPPEVLAVSHPEVRRVPASHELVEMLGDPAMNLMTTGGEDGVFYAHDSADPVEEEPYFVKGITMSDFVYLAYFENFHKPGSVQPASLPGMTSAFCGK